MLCAVTVLNHASAVIRRVVAENRMVGRKFAFDDSESGSRLVEFFLEKDQGKVVVVVGLARCASTPDGQGGLCAALGILDARTTTRSPGTN